MSGSIAVAQAADAQPAAPAAAADAALPTADALLEMLHQRGQDLTAFTADVTMAESDAGLTKIYTGKAWFERKPEATRFRISFTKWSDGEKEYDEGQDYLLDGAWLVDRNYRQRIEVRRQVLKPGQKMDLLKLGEGPFPLPIGQKPEDVKAQFDVAVRKPRKSDPAGTHRLQFIPRQGTELADRFESIDVNVDPATRMPVRVKTIEKKNQAERTTDLRNMQVNPKVTDADFKLPALNAANWNVKEEPMR
jgi:hypothetical protein